jgi:hypothetical protein
MVPSWVMVPVVGSGGWVGAGVSVGTAVAVGSTTLSGVSWMTTSVVGVATTVMTTGVCVICSAVGAASIWATALSGILVSVGRVTHKKMTAMARIAFSARDTPRAMRSLLDITTFPFCQDCTKKVCRAFFNFLAKCHCNLPNQITSQPPKFVCRIINLQTTSREVDVMSL